MLQIKGLGKAFRGEWLFRSLDSQINERDRIGLVGDNGTGKSTLMKMIAGLMPADEGEVIGSRDLTFGYLPQDGLFARGRTLLEEALSVFQSLRILEQEIGQLEHELADMQHSGPEYEKKLERYSLITHKFRLEEGYSIEARAGSVLLGLGFTRNDLDRPCDAFSGGWQLQFLEQLALPCLRLRSFFCRNRVCFSWMNRPITWIWRHATGWKIFLRLILTPWFWFPMIATFWIPVRNVSWRSEIVPYISIKGITRISFTSGRSG